MREIVNNLRIQIPKHSYIDLSCFNFWNLKVRGCRFKISHTNAKCLEILFQYVSDVVFCIVSLRQHSSGNCTINRVSFVLMNKVYDRNSEEEKRTATLFCESCLFLRFNLLVGRRRSRYSIENRHDDMRRILCNDGLWRYASSIDRKFCSCDHTCTVLCTYRYGHANISTVNFNHFSNREIRWYSGWKTNHDLFDNTQKPAKTTSQMRVTSLYSRDWKTIARW